jgi:hypothetical protein
VRVQRIDAGLWRWTGDHPDWTREKDWPQAVGCVYAEVPDAIVLIDPLVPPEDRERFIEALDRDVERVGRPVRIMLTVDWHARSSGELVDRYGATVGGARPAGVEAFPVEPVDETLWWLPAHGAIVAGDVLLGDGGGGIRVCPDSWLEGRTTPEEIRAVLHPLLDLPVGRVLVSHGEPVIEGGRDALAAALSR